MLGMQRPLAQIKIFRVGLCKAGGVDGELTQLVV